jgi:hypothetical protein
MVPAWLSDARSFGLTDHLKGHSHCGGMVSLVPWFNGSRPFRNLPKSCSEYGTQPAHSAAVGVIPAPLVPARCALNLQVEDQSAAGLRLGVSGPAPRSPIPVQKCRLG